MSKKAIIYLRVSSAGQVNTAHDPEGYSIPGQREACQRYAATLGARVIREYVEPGKSGTSLSRPALQQMLGELDELQPDYVIFYDLSRVARDDFDALWLLREIEGRGCKLESTLERVDDTPAGKLLYTVMAGVNAFRSRGDAEKVKMGLDRKFQAGGSAGPAGWATSTSASRSANATWQPSRLTPNARRWSASSSTWRPQASTPSRRWLISSPRQGCAPGHRHPVHPVRWPERPSTASCATTTTPA